MTNIYYEQLKRKLKEIERIEAEYEMTMNKLKNEEMEIKELLDKIKDSDT